MKEDTHHRQYLENYLPETEDDELNQSLEFGGRYLCDDVFLAVFIVNFILIILDIFYGVRKSYDLRARDVTNGYPTYVPDFFTHASHQNLNGGPGSTSFAQK